jgi:hypothetical protein
MGAARWVYFSLAVSLLFGGGGALAEVYRWKDSSGKVHFGDRPNSTDPQVVKEVVVPSPNLATGFKGTPSTTFVDPTKAISGGETIIPAAPVGAAEDSKPKSAPKRGFAAQSQDSCKAQKAAYRASRACFVACGRPIYGRGHDNTGCEYCDDQPMPNC